MANPIKVLSTVRSIEDRGEGVYLVTFGLPARATKFHPGQFLHLTLDPFDPTTGFWPQSRVFSIASEPRLDHVTVVYSVKGTYTRRMEAELKVGKEVWLKLPYGDFVIDEGLLKVGPVVLVAGGTGVSPYIPFLLQPRSHSGTVHLYYGVRREEHLLFSHELEKLTREPWFQRHLVVGQLLSIDSMKADLGAQFGHANFFLSGPPIMITSFKAELLARAISAQQIHIDEWE